MKRILPWVMSVLLAFTCLNISPSSAKAAETNLVVNGSFENPEVTEFYPGVGLGYFPSIEGWQLFAGSRIEVQRGVAGKSDDGKQHVELDALEVSGIYQDIPTEVGKSYKLSLAFSASPGVKDNKLNVHWGDTLVAELSKSGEGLSDTDWEVYSFDVEATGATTALKFDNLNELSDGMGSYIDAVSVVEKSLPVIGEVGSISNLDHKVQTVSLSHNFTAPVVLAQPPSYLGSDPVAVRLSNVTSNSFDVRLQEPSNMDDTHAQETLSFIVLEAGRWQLDDGTVLEVGLHDTSTTVGRKLGSSFDTVNFSTGFGAAPVVFTELQTSKGSDFVYTRQQLTTTDGFQVAMQEEESKTDGHGRETIGWLAIEATGGNWSGHGYQSQTVSGIAQNFVNVPSIGYDGVPKLIAAVASYKGSDSVGLRYQNLTDNSVEIKLEEETSFDKEISHAGEDVSLLTIEGSGELRAGPAS